MISNRPKEAKIPSPDKRLLFVMITSGSCWSFTMIWCKAFGSKMYSCDEKNGPQILTNLPTVQISGVGWGYQIKGQSHIASASWLWRPKPRSWTIVQNYSPKRNDTDSGPGTLSRSVLTNSRRTRHQDAQEMTQRRMPLVTTANIGIEMQFYLRGLCSQALWAIWAAGKHPLFQKLSRAPWPIRLFVIARFSDACAIEILRCRVDANGQKVEPECFGLLIRPSTSCQDN